MVWKTAHKNPLELENGEENSQWNLCLGGVRNQIKIFDAEENYDNLNIFFPSLQQILSLHCQMGKVFVTKF